MRYDSRANRKHKRPKGWGSLCPKEIDLEEAQALLESSVLIDDQRFNVREEYALRAQWSETSPDGEERWHGHPIPWRALPPDAVRALIAAGRLQPGTFLKAFRQNWGEEFAR